MMGKRIKNTGGRPRTLQRRVSRQVSLCGESDEKAREMNNFSAFVRGCLAGRTEGVPEGSVRLAAVIAGRIMANEYDKELNQWKSAEAHEAYDAAHSLIMLLKAL